MVRLSYSKEHLEKLREFFGDEERNKKFREIIQDFPSLEQVKQLNETEIQQLHLKVIKALLQDIYLSYREKLLKWAEITRQTAIVDPEYLSMHLISIFTGVVGTGTAARGFDLADGSEVKSSSRVEQLGRCKVCGAAVMSFEEKCGSCGSEDIKRKYDSHWIFSLRSEDEIEKLLSRPLIYLVLMDYEDIEKRDIIRIRIWKLDPKDHFVQIFFRDYYFLEYFKKRRERGETPAPCNLHPDKPLTRSLKPLLVFLGKVNFSESKISIEFIDSDGVPDKISSFEAKRLLSKGSKFFNKIIQLGKKDEYEKRIKDMIQDTEPKLEKFMK